MIWYIKCLNQYADFNSRASLQEYWSFTFFNWMFGIATMFLDIFFFGVQIGDFFPINTIFALLVLVPGLAVTARRLHDTGNSGKYFFLILLPIIGPFWLLALLLRKSQEGENMYGPPSTESLSEKLLDPNTLKDSVLFTSSLALVFVFGYFGYSKYFTTPDFDNIEVGLTIYGLTFLLLAAVPLSMVAFVHSPILRITGLILGALFYIYCMIEYVITAIAIMEYAKPNPYF